MYPMKKEHETKLIEKLIYLSCWIKIIKSSLLVNIQYHSEEYVFIWRRSSLDKHLLHIKSVKLEYKLFARILDQIYISTTINNMEIYSLNIS